MFGQNKIAGPRTLTEGYLVKEIFYTLQGEGPWAGKPAVFVRFSDCNLACKFCDTDFTGGNVYTVAQLVDAVNTVRKRENYFCNRVVITGGEPLLQDLVPFLDILNGEGILTQIETSGSVFPWSAPHRHIFLNSVIVCSPKTPKVHSFFVSQADYWKYIIKAGETDEEGLPCWSTQLENTAGKIYRPYPLRKDKIYVQACDEGDVMKNAANLAEATRIALQFGYNLSIQTHKIVGVP